MLRVPSSKRAPPRLASMRYDYEVGDLVHIPQAVKLVECSQPSNATGQLVIPSRILETCEPKLGVVMERSSQGYLRVYCDGGNWSVRGQSVFKLEAR